NHQTLTIAQLFGNVHYPAVIGPLQHEEIDIGETLPARCLRQGLWLAEHGGIPFAFLLSPASRYGQEDGTHVEGAFLPGEAGLRLTSDLLNEFETLVKQTATYRGKVISFEPTDRYSGHGGLLRVHKLRGVRREEVILPERTLQLLDRNIAGF